MKVITSVIFALAACIATASASPRIKGRKGVANKGWKSTCDIDSYVGSTITIQSADPKNVYKKHNGQMDGRYICIEDSGKAVLKAYQDDDSQKFNVVRGESDGKLYLESVKFPGHYLHDDLVNPGITVEAECGDEGYGKKYRRNDDYGYSSYGHDECSNTWWEVSCVTITKDDGYGYSSYSDNKEYAWIESSIGLCLDDYAATDDGVQVSSYKCDEDKSNLHRLWNIYITSGKDDASYY
ncbi:hypothetical protein HK101_005076 [Irineochytrium annulatum]|nr:hypothetical protein HK101_005076 [Irineochytrium annulatum]